eukprot:gene1139-1700_t
MEWIFGRAGPWRPPQEEDALSSDDDGIKTPSSASDDGAEDEGYVRKVVPQRPEAPKVEEGAEQLKVLLKAEGEMNQALKDKLDLFEKKEAARNDMLSWRKDLKGKLRPSALLPEEEKALAASAAATRSEEEARLSLEAKVKGLRNQVKVLSANEAVATDEPKPNLQQEVAVPLSKEELLEEEMHKQGTQLARVNAAAAEKPQQVEGADAPSEDQLVHWIAALLVSLRGPKAAARMGFAVAACAA